MSYTSSFLMCSRGRRRASVPRPGPSLSGVLTAAGSNVCANFQEFLTMLTPPKMPDSLKITKKYWIWGLTRCHDNSILDINNPFTVSHRPCFYSILMKFEANWVKVRWWIQSILKMTHFLLPVGGAITLPHNCHINAIGFIHRTNRWDLYVYRVSY